MKNTDVKGLLSQLRTAAEAIKAQIREADDQVAALTEQRRALTEAPVSKADIMEYVRADIQRRAASYLPRLERWARKSAFPLGFSFAQLERTHVAKLERTHVAQSFQNFPYLDGETSHNFGAIEPCALYWHFGGLIAERFSIALDTFDLPGDTVPVADRRRLIAEIDAKLQAINARRDSLASDLINSGMYE